MIERLKRTALVYGAIAGMMPKVFLAYNVWFWLNLFVQGLSMLIFVYFWRAIYAEQSSIAGLDLRQTLNYILLAQLIAGVGESGVLWDLGSLVREGRIGLELLRPLDFQASQYVQNLVAWFTGLITRLPLLPLALALGLELPSDPLAYVCFLVTLLLGATWLFFFMWILACLTFYTTEVWGLGVLVFGVALFFSGQLVPLQMMPDWLERLALALPFSQISYVPVSFLSGITPVADAWRVWLTQLAWIAGLLVVSRFVFARAVRVVTVQGG